MDSSSQKKDLHKLMPYLGNAMENHLGMKFLPTDEDGTIHAEMAVDHRTCQPFGCLSGGASLALAETLAGYGSYALCPPSKYPCGMQVTGNHVMPAMVGDTVHASGKLVHRGATTHIWDITIKDSEDHLISVVRVVNYIQRRK